MDTEFVTDAQWDSYAHRVMSANLKRDGHSLSPSGIARRANTFIVDIQSDRKGMIVKKGWREAMKQASGEIVIIGDDEEADEMEGRRHGPRPGRQSKPVERPTTIYTVIEGEGPHPFSSRILTPKARKPSEMGFFDDPGEASQETKAHYGQDAEYVSPEAFEQECKRREELQQQVATLPPQIGDKVHIHCVGFGDGQTGKVVSQPFYPANDDSSYYYLIDLPKHGSIAFAEHHLEVIPQKGS